MPFLALFAQSQIARRLALGVALAVLLLAAWKIWDRSIRAEERAALAARQAQELKADRDTLSAKLDMADSIARMRTDELAQARAARSELLAEIAHRSAAHDDRCGLAPDSVQRLDGLRTRQPADRR